MQHNSKPAYRLRRLVQFRLRTLLVLLLAASLLMGWWRHTVQRYGRQQEALAEVAHLAKFVAFEPGQPAWLRPFADEAVFRDVVHLSFQSRRDFKDEHIVHLAKMPRLRRLSLQHARISDEGLKHLAKLEHLDTLSLESTRVGNEGMPYLSDLPRLRMLQLNGTNVTGAGLEHLVELPSLERLEIVNQRIGNDDLQPLTRMPRLRQLEVGNSKFTLAGWKTLSDLPLEELEIYGPESLEIRLEHMEHLRSLDIAAWRIHDVILVDLPNLSQLKFRQHIGGNVWLMGLPRLRDLNLDGKELSDRTFQSVTSLPNLEKLSLAHARPRSGSWRNLRRLKSIKELDLTATGIDDHELRHLSELKTLEVLRLNVNPIHAKALRQLSQLSNLRVLDISHTPLFESELASRSTRGNLRRSALFRSVFLPDDSFRSLLELKQLRRLNVDNTGIAFEELMLLSELPNLEHVGIFSHELSREELAAVCNELKSAEVSATPATRFNAQQIQVFESESEQLLRLSRQLRSYREANSREPDSE